ncbi:hypothetical protein ACOSP7_010799 [Xanthoceras sorbifolium]
MAAPNILVYTISALLRKCQAFRFLEELSYAAGSRYLFFFLACFVHEVSKLRSAGSSKLGIEFSKHQKTVFKFWV